jgi:RNA polymerase sigma-B factor
MSNFADNKQQTDALIREYRATGAEDIRDRIIEKNLFLSEILARKYINRGVEYDDLFQIASYALFLAVERFDPDKGVLFTSFATPTIIGEIKKYFRDSAWALKVPRRLKDISLRIPAAKEALQEELHRVPRVAELAARLGVAEEDVLEALESSQAYSTYSLDQEDDSPEAGDNPMFEKYLGTAEKGYADIEMSGVLKNVMDELTDAEKDIMRKRFLDELSQREVAEVLGVSQMTVSRIERAMRDKFKAEYNR